MSDPSTTAPRGQAPSARFVRSARFWMRAYPPRWRAVRGEELLGVLSDLAGPDAGRLGFRGALDLVRAGWATRWREHPALLPWLGYRLLGRSIRTHRAWMQDDILGAGYPVRTMPVVLVLLVFNWLNGIDVWPLIGLWLGATPALPWTRHRVDALRRHVAPRPGERLYVGALVVQDGPRGRTDVGTVLPWFLGAATVLACASAATMATAPLGIWSRPIPGGSQTGVGPIVNRWPLLVIALLAVAAGAVLAHRARRQVPALLETPVEQPHRRIRPFSRVARVRVLTWMLVALWVLGLEVTGRLVLGLSVIVWIAVALTLPAAVVARSVLRARPGAPVAAVDVWRAAILGRPPVVDGPTPVLAPLEGTVPEDAVLPPRRLGEPARVVLP